jgi:hypothetical protein
VHMIAEPQIYVSCADSFTRFVNLAKDIPSIL